MRDTFNTVGAVSAATARGGHVTLEAGTTPLGLVSDTGSALSTLFRSANPVTAQPQSKAQALGTISEIGFASSGTIALDKLTIPGRSRPRTARCASSSSARAASLPNNHQWSAVGGTGDGGIPP